ncbi:MAG: histidine phosphatase family protein [Elusimicrobiaceae bacterium]|nr:histidine phosphatase family protein [Elusimicrobiaceae bacterium]
MKKLILVRHAHALSCAEAKVSSDRLRPLSARGQEKARQTAQALLTQDIHPQIILTSPLERALETARILANVLNAPVQTESLLNGFAMEEEICHSLIEQLDSYDTVIAVGHNPNITYITHGLVRQVRPFAPGSFAVINMDDVTQPQLIYFGE